MQPPIRICAHTFWNRTGIVFRRGSTYQLSAKGTWVDFFNRSGPAGYTSALPYMKALEPKRRSPKANWFALMGAIGQNVDALFTIGCQASVTANADGELCCFANDVPGWYWNNWGYLELDVAS